jgi:hypothetical protein
MAGLLGFTSILIVLLVALIIALRWPEISKILFVGLSIRIFFLLTNHFFIFLPDSTGDSVEFEERAWDLARNGFLSVLSNFDLNPFIFFSWLHAIPYSIFGRSILMAQSIGLLFGIGSIFLAWKLAKILWDVRTANKVAWTIALFPSLILYSVLFLREVYISFFLLLSVYALVNWIKTNSLKWSILSLLGFIVAGLFHGPIFLGFIIAATIVIIKYFKKLFILLINLRIIINIKSLIIFSVTTIIFGSFIFNKIEVPYIGNFRDVTYIELILIKQNNLFIFRGDASWPEWTVVQNLNEFFYKIPIRSLYFLFSPFPWDIAKPQHLFGFFDAILYMYLVFLILRNIKVILTNPALIAILIILLFYILMYAYGTGNFGTSIRHKTKFTFMFILLAAPLIKRFVFDKKKFN